MFILLKKIIIVTIVTFYAYVDITEWEESVA